MATTYSAPEYDDEKYRQGIDTSYYTNAIKKYSDTQEKNRTSQIQEAGKTRDNALREAYVSRLQNQKTLNDNLARAGIRGGATETSNLKLANTYAQQRNAANSDYSSSVSATNKAIDENILNYDMDMTSRAEEYAQNLAQAKWNAAREDYANAIAQQNYEAEQAYQKERDAVSDAQWEKDYAVSKQNADLEAKLSEQTYQNNVYTEKSNYIYDKSVKRAHTKSTVDKLNGYIKDLNKKLKTETDPTKLSEIRGKINGYSRAITDIKTSKDYNANK